MGLEAAHRSDQLQPRAHGLLSIVLVSLRIAEINQHPVPHVLRYEPAEALHGLGDALLVGRNDLAEVFRVHAGRECRRADQVAEHHRYLAALGGVLRLRLDHGVDLHCGRGSASKLTDCAQNLAAITKDNADVFQVLIGQVAKDRKINAIFGKTIRVLGQTELFEPVGDLLHGAKPTRPSLR